MAPCRCCLLAVPVMLLLVTGCTSTQVNRLQAENRQLSEQAQSLLAEVQNIKAHSRRIEDQLLQAENDLVAFEQQSGIDRQKLANLQREREKLGRFWTGDGRNGALGVSGQLAELAKKYPSLQYDPQTGISKLDTDILFESGDAELKAGAQRLLDDLAALLQSPEARELKVMVVGHTDDQGIKGRETRSKYPTNWHLSSARALSVADRLRASGLSAERMGVAGFGAHQPIAANDSESSRQQNRRVEIFVMSPEVPIVGMTETLSRLY